MGLYRIVKQYSGPGLNPGESAVVTYTYVVPDTLLPTSGWLWVYVQADMYWGDGAAASGTSAHGRIIEGDEMNNISGPAEVYLNPNVYLPVVRK